MAAGWLLEVSHSRLSPVSWLAADTQYGIVGFNVPLDTLPVILEMILQVM